MNKKSLALSLSMVLLLLLSLSQIASVHAAHVTVPHRGHHIIESIGDPETVDPAWAYDTASGEIIANVYEPLIFFDREETGKYVPVLSTEVPSVENGLIKYINEPQSDTGITWKERVYFPIRGMNPATGVSSTVKFHNGEYLTMEDVEYTFERWMVQDRSGGPTWMIYEPVQGIGNVHAFYLTGDAAKQSLIVQNAVQRNNTHVWFNFAVPYAPILGVLAQFWASILDKSFVTAVQGEWPGTFPVDWTYGKYWDPSESYLDAAGNVMCGTGPYKKDYWTHGVEWSIVKFDDYWGGWPYKYASDFLYRVTEKVVYEWSTRLADFRAGTADTVYVPRQYMEQVRGWPGIRGLPETPPGSPWGLPSLSADGMFYTQQIDPATPYVGSGKFDGSGIPLDFFSDIHVRKAFSYLFNWTKFIDEVWLNEAVQPSSPVIEGIPYHKDVTMYAIDLAKAAEQFKLAFDGTLADPGPVWDNGFYLKITFNSGNQPRETSCKILRDNLALLNQPPYNAPKPFVIDTLGVTWSTYLGELWWYPSGLSIMPIYMIGWVADYPDAHNWVFPFMHSKGDFSAPSSYYNATVDAKIEQGISTADGPAREAIYAELQQLYYDDCPNVMMEQAIGRRWERDWVQGWYYNAIATAQFYHRWEGLNGDVNNDKTIDALDGGDLNEWYYLPPFLGPSSQLYGYNVRYDIGPVLQYGVGTTDPLPPPGDSVGTIDSVDRSVINAHFFESEG